MDIAGTVMPWIVCCMISEQLELVGNKGADDLWHLLEVVGEIAQVLPRLE